VKVGSDLAVSALATAEVLTLALDLRSRKPVSGSLGVVRAESSDQQIAAIGNGEAVSKNLRSRTPDEIFVFRAVYIMAEAHSYLSPMYGLKYVRESGFA
jgi:hypothetical protein